MRTIVNGFAVGLILVSTAAAQSIFIPNGTATTEGSSSTSYPWNRNASAIRVQYVYDSTHFTNQGISYPILVTGLRWRANATTASWTGTTYSNVEIGCATAALDYTAVSGTFASNRGNDYTNVYQGSVNVIPGMGNGTGVPGPMYVDVTLQNSFLYDPTSGDDFLCEVAFAANSWSGGGTTAVDAASTGSLTSRIYNLSDPTSATGTTQQNVGVVMEVLHNPASGLYANFSANVTSGASPLAVTFQDTSFTSDPSGVQTWAWDFDDDGTIDSTLANPTYIYNTCGSYSVRLTVTDTLHPTSTVTKTDFIDVDPQLRVTADFTSAPNAGAVPLAVTFTDTSAGSPTQWAWDFDTNGTIDSTAQNPSWSYTQPGFYTVTMTATNACYSDTVVKANLIQVVGATSNTESPAYLEYQFNAVRGTRAANTASTTFFPPFGQIPNTGWQVDPGRPVFRGNEAGFGALAYGAAGNYVDSGTSLNLSGSLTIAFWQRRDPASTSSSPFGYFFSDNSFRCFMGSAGIFFGGGTGSPLSSTYNGGFTGFLTQGVWNHYAIVVDDAAGVATWYENGVAATATASFAAGTYAYSGSANFTVGATPTGGSRATGHFDMDDFRFYARALSQSEIQTVMLRENPTTSTFDAGCTDANGFTATLGANGAPKLGNASFAIEAGGMEPGRASAIVYGIEAHTGGLFPFDLSGTGLFGPGCNLHVLPVIIAGFQSAGGAVSFPTPIPLDPSIAGGHVYVQTLTLGSGAFGGVSNALDVNFQM